MKRVLSLIWVLPIILASRAWGQSIIYGLPSAEKNLKKGDIMIVNLPPHQDGRLLDSEQLLPIVGLLNKYPALQFRIEFHVFYETSDFNLDYTTRLARGLIKHLAPKVSQKNYEAIGLGSSSPIFLKEGDPVYLKMNTRLQIRVN